MHHFFCGFIDVSRFERPHFARVGVVVIVRQAELHDVDDGLSECIQRLARSRQTQRLVRLNLRQFIGYSPDGRRDPAQFLIHLDHRFFRLVGLHRPTA
jgi:hypothetical protein